MRSSRAFAAFVVVAAFAATAGLGGVAGAWAPAASAPAPVVTTPPGPGEAEAPWALVGTEQSGAVLVLGSLTVIDDCHDIRPEVTSVDDESVRVRLIYYQTTDDETANGCTRRDIDKGLPTERVRLDGPLRGRSVTGPGKRSLVRTVGRSWNVGPKGARTYEQTGILVSEAAENLRAFGIARRDIRVRGPRDGYVVRVSPRLPKTIKRSRKIAVYAAGHATASTIRP
jgi:hypothetical protein